MTQPPDRRPPPPETPETPETHEDPPTVAWSSPDAPPTTPDAAPQTPVATPPADREDPVVPPSGPTSPIPPVAWEPPRQGTPGPGQPATGAILGWQPPDEGLPPAPTAGYVTAGIGSRLVAWVLDGMLTSVLAVVILAITMAIVGVPEAPAEAVATWVAFGLVYGAIEFLYFVGFWTGPRRGTPGMRSIGLEVVDATSGDTLHLRQAVIRWAALGLPLTLLTVIPQLSELVGWVLIGWSVFLLLTTGMSPQNRGVHDRWAGSSVIRRAGASTNATAIGCLVIALILVTIFIILPFVLVLAAGDDLERILIEMGNSI